MNIIYITIIDNDKYNVDYKKKDDLIGLFNLHIKITLLETGIVVANSKFQFQCNLEFNLYDYDVFQI